MRTIETFYAFTIVHDDGDEGIVTYYAGGGSYQPLIAGSEERAEQLKWLARQRAADLRKPIKLVRFTQREEIETFDP